MNKPLYWREIVISIIVFFGLLFTATNVNVTLGNTYLWFVGGILFLLLIDSLIFNKNVEITFQKQPGGTLKSILIGFGGWIVLLISSVIIINFVDPAKANFASIISLLGATTPALANSKIANWAIFSLMVPFAETVLWARALEFFANIFKIPVNKKSLRKIGFIFLIAILSLAFLLFHLTAKGVTAYASLVIVFAMMFISLIMVTWTGEIRSAFWLHAIANGISSFIMLWAVGNLI